MQRWFYRQPPRHDRRESLLRSQPIPYLLPGGAGAILWLINGEIRADRDPPRADARVVVAATVEAFDLGLPV